MRISRTFGFAAYSNACSLDKASRVPALRLSLNQAADALRIAARSFFAFIRLMQTFQCPFHALFCILSNTT